MTCRQCWSSPVGTEAPRGAESNAYTAMERRRRVLGFRSCYTDTTQGTAEPKLHPGSRGELPSLLARLLREGWEHAQVSKVFDVVVACALRRVPRHGQHVLWDKERAQCHCCHGTAASAARLPGTLHPGKATAQADRVEPVLCRAGLRLLCYSCSTGALLQRRWDLSSAKVWGCSSGEGTFELSHACPRLTHIPSEGELHIRGRELSGCTVQNHRIIQGGRDP